MEFLHFACMSNCPSTKKYWAKTYTERVCISINWLRHWATETETEHCENIHVSFHAAFIFCMFSTIWTRQDVLLIFSELEQMSQITCTSTWDFLINKLEQNIYFELLAGWWQLKHCKNCAICPSEVFWKVKFLCQLCFSCPVCPNVHKQVGDCRISYNLQLSCVRWYLCRYACIAASISLNNQWWVYSVPQI